MNLDAVCIACRKSGCYARAVVQMDAIHTLEQRLLAMAVTVLAVVPIGRMVKSLHLHLVDPRLLC